MRVEPARLLAVGLGSVVLETADGIVFRVPRTADGAAGHDLEERLLPELHGKLPAAVPLPEWRVPPGGDELPFGALGYRRLPGAVPDRPHAGLAADIGALARALHGIPAPASLRRRARWRERALGAARLVPSVAEHLADRERRVLEAWAREAPSDVRMRSQAVVLVHGDLWYGNLLVDGDPPRLSGVLDWEGAAIGDPAEDLAPHHYLGEELAAAVLDAYGADTELRYRARRYRELREFAGIGWSLERRDEAELAESVAKLLRTPIFDC